MSDDASRTVFTALAEAVAIAVAALIASQLVGLAAVLSVSALVRSNPLATNLGELAAELTTSPELVAAFLGGQSLVLIAVALVLRGRRWEAPQGERSLSARLALAFAVGVALLVAANAISWLLELAGVAAEEQGWVLELVGRGPAAIAVLVPWLVVVGPLAEELFFRGYLFCFLSARVGALAAALLSALAFALVHLNPSAFPIYLVMGLILAWSVHRHRSLVVVVVAHALNNAVALTLTALR